MSIGVPTVAYTLELLHFSDQEASSAALADAPRASAVVNALRAQDLFDDGLADNTLFLSSGDAYIPSPFLEASIAVFTPFNDTSRGIADILIQNELGVQAIAFGNHEFDLGPGLVRSLILGNTSPTGSPNATGTNYPYLSCNLNFTTEPALNSLQVPRFGAPLPRSITSSVVFNVGNQTIGVVGATTPILRSISTAGGVGVRPQPFDGVPTPAQLDALAAIIQAEVDGLIAANSGMNKVILLTHMQTISIEFALAPRLRNVDIIVAGGSNTRLFDANDRVRAGDSVQGQYPTYFLDADNKTTAVVNTDGNYKYIGRLVIGFDSNGNLIPSTYNATVSGAYATDDAGVALLNSTGTATINPTIQRVTRLLEGAISALEGDVLGLSTVFLNGNRGSGPTDPIRTDGVRTQETNLGDLTADANLYYARLTDPNVTISIKNGGGIRASIGQIVVPSNSTTALRLRTEEVRASNGTLIKPSGGISQLDVKTALAFNNALSLVTVTKTELKAIMEYGISGLTGPQGRMCQVGGVSITFNSSLPANARILSMSITSLTPPQLVVSNGLVVGDASETFRLVTLDFLLTGGDGYTFPNRSRTLLSIDEGTSSFAPRGTEQDAFAEYLLKFHKTTPYNQVDTDRLGDQRLIDLAFVPAPVPVPVPVTVPVPVPVPVRVPVPVTPPVPANRPTNAPFRANTKAPVSKAPVINPPSKAPSKAPTKAPTTAPQRDDCGILGLNVFCPFTFCGLFGRLLGLCD